MKKKQKKEEIVKHEEPPKLSIVLNGGSTKMDDATIPVKWFFSPEFVKEKPKYILLVDLDRNEIGSLHYGKRYLYPVDNSVAFI